MLPPLRPRPLSLRYAPLCCAWAAVAGVAIGGSESAAAPSERTRDDWQSPLTIAWSNQPLGEALERLGAATRSAAWLDRRIDPTTPLNYRCEQRPALEVAEDLARERGLVVYRLGDLLYVGSPPTAALVRRETERLREAAARLPANLRRKWSTATAVEWPPLSEPRQLVVDVAEANGAEVVNPATVPHDLWDARRLPPLTGTERLALLLAQFDLAAEFEDSGKRLRLAPAQMPAAAADESPPRRASASASASAATTRRSPTATPLDQQRFTLRVRQQPLGAILDRIGQQTGVRFAWHDENVAQTARTRRVDCEVREADLDELLDSLLQPLGLHSVRSDGQVRIEPAPTP